jgi:hypothetical protein
MAKAKKEQKTRWVICPECSGRGYYVKSHVYGTAMDPRAGMTCRVCQGNKRIQVQGDGRCFIATAAYDSAFAPEVECFRQFRDQNLLTSKAGRGFVSLYYFASPPFARLIASVPLLKIVVRTLLLKPTLGILRRKSKD